MLMDKGLIGEETVRNLLTWRHSGFSVHGAVRVEGRQGAARLGRYMIRCPVADPLFPAAKVYIHRLMNKATLLLVLSCTILPLPGLHAQEGYSDVMLNIGDANYGTFDDDNPYATEGMLNHVRRERFDLILPRVMREHDVDMWIHIIRPWAWGGTDPLRYELGSKSGVFVFTDRGDDGIERVAFQGDVQDPGAYDSVSEEDGVHQPARL